jgi:hypothetical protein
MEDPTPYRYTPRPSKAVKKPRQKTNPDAEEMTMRDIFAAFVLAGLHANPAPEVKSLGLEDIAEISYEQADVILLARKDAQ